MCVCVASKAHLEQDYESYGMKAPGVEASDTIDSVQQEEQDEVGSVRASVFDPHCHYS